MEDKPNIEQVKGQAPSEVVDTTAVPEQAKIVQEETDTPKRKSTLLPLIFVLLLLIFLVGIYYLVFELNILDRFTNKNTDNDTVNTQQEEDNQEEDVQEDENQQQDTPQLTLFQGKFVSTNLPEGWTVVEYSDGDGSDMLTPGVGYVGLTGLKIFKEETELFFMQAVSGLGFAGCPQYAKFSDENPDYYAQILEDNEVSGQTLTLSDYTNTKYEEFNWFNTPFRRINTSYVYDTELGNSYFEPPCVPTLVSFPNVLEYYMDGDTHTTTFDYGVIEGATEADLLVIDQILSDMKVV